MHRKLLAALFAAASLFACGQARAVCPVIPFVFAQGSTWNAGQVNANFSSLYNCASSPSSMPFVLNTAALEALAPAAYSFIQRQYNVSVVDGASIWLWNGASTCAADGGLTCVIPASAPPTGRWVLDSHSAYGLTLNPGGSNYLTFDPTQTTINVLRGVFTSTGAVSSTPTDTNNAAMMWIRETSNATGMGINTGMATAEFNMNATNTTNHSDSYIGLAGNANFLETSSGAGFTAIVGVVASARAVAAQGGGMGSEKGEVHGLNVVSGLGGTAAHYTDSILIEGDSVSSATTTMAIRQGVAIFDFGDGLGNPGSQGSTNDAAFVVGNRSSVGWKNAFYLTTNAIQTTGSFPLSNDGCILCTDVINAAAGIDLVNVNVSPSSGYAFRGPGSLFYATGAGDVLAQSIEAQDGLITNAATGSNAVVQFRDAETAKWNIAREATTDDFIILSDPAGTPINRLRINNSTGETTIGHTNALAIGDTGSLKIPGISTSVGSITGAVCFDNGTKTTIYKAGAGACI